jgi:hypothetical protein
MEDKCMEHSIAKEGKKPNKQMYKWKRWTVEDGTDMLS